MSDEEIGTEEVIETAEVEEAPVAEEVITEDVVESGEEPEAAETFAVRDETPPPALASPAGLPPRKQTGLIVVVGSIVLILILALVFWQPLASVVSKVFGGSDSTAVKAETPSKTKLTTAVGFVEAILDGDTMSIKGFLSDEAQASATATQWAAMAASDVTGSVKFAPATWSGDTTAVVTYSAPNEMTGVDTTGTLTFSIVATDPLSVAMEADSEGAKDTITVKLAAAGASWRVLSLTSGTDTQSYDAAFIKSIVDQISAP
jgi:hypothetical protein